MDNRTIDAGLEAYVDKIFESIPKSPNMNKVVALVKIKAQQKYDTSVGQGYSPNQAAVIVKDWLEKFKIVLSQVGKTNTDGSVVNPNAASDMAVMLKEDAAAPAAKPAPVAPAYVAPTAPAYEEPAEEAVYAAPVEEVYAEPVYEEPVAVGEEVDASYVIDDYSPIPSKVKVVDSKKKAKAEKAAKAEKPAKVKAEKPAKEKAEKPAKEKAEKPAKAKSGKGGKIVGIIAAVVVAIGALAALYIYLIAPLLG